MFGYVEDVYCSALTKSRGENSGSRYTGTENKLQGEVAKAVVGIFLLCIVSSNVGFPVQRMECRWIVFNIEWLYEL